MNTHIGVESGFLIMDRRSVFVDGLFECFQGFFQNVVLAK